MARTKRNIALDSRTNRLKLEIEKKHFAPIGKKLAISYRRRKTGNSSFSCRMEIGNNKYKYFLIGETDDYKDADGQTVFTYYQAVDKARQIEQEQKKLKGLVKGNYTIVDACNDYFEWYKANRKRPHETKLIIDNVILPFFKNIELSKITKTLLEKFLNGMANSPKKHRGGFAKKVFIQKAPETDDEKRARKSTANRNYAVLRTILNKAFENEYIDSRTAWERVKVFEKTDQARVRFLTCCEVKSLLNNCHDIDLKRFVAGALFTGARYSELEHATVSDYSKDTGFFYIRPSKSGKSREVPLNTEGKMLFESCTVGKKVNDFIFTKNGKKWKQANLYYMFCLACKNAELEKVTFHELRHTYASNLAQNGVDLLTISKLLGHSNVSITARYYAHLCDKTLIKAVNKLEFEYHDEELEKLIQLNSYVFNISKENELKGRSEEDFEKDLIEQLNSFKGKKVFNKSINNNIEFRNSSIKKYKSFMADKRKYLVIPYIPQLLKEAVFKKEPSYTPNTEPNIKAYWKSNVLAKINENETSIQITVREDNNGNVFWDLQIKENPQHATPATNLGDTGISTFIFS